MDITNRQFLKRSSVSLPAPYRRIKRVRQQCQQCACRQGRAIRTHGKWRTRIGAGSTNGKGDGKKHGPKPDHQHGRKESERERDEDTQQRGKRSSRKGATSEKTERQRTTRTTRITLPELHSQRSGDRPPNGSGSGRSCQRQGSGYIAIRGRHGGQGRQVYTLRYRAHNRHCSRMRETVTPPPSACSGWRMVVVYDDGRLSENRRGRKGSGRATLSEMEPEGSTGTR
jgi:hypothetical protein